MWKAGRAYCFCFMQVSKPLTNEAYSGYNFLVYKEPQKKGERLKR